MCLSVEERARVGLGHKFLSFENGRKAPPFLCLVSKASLELTLNPISVCFGDVNVVCGLDSLLSWLQSCAVVIQFALSEMFVVFSRASDVGVLRGINSSRTGVGT